MRRFFVVIGMFLILMNVPFAVIQAQATITVITLNPLRLRAGPGTQHSIITIVPAGTSLIANARNAKSDWVRVDYQGQSGWLYVPQLRIQGNLASLPLADATAGADGAAAPTPTPPPPNGSIVSMNLLIYTDRVAYYRFVYWSDGLRVAGYYAEPRGFGKFPALIFNRSGNRDTGALTGMEIVPFAEAGFVVAASQYRGGKGSEGQEEFGGADVNDVLNLIPFLKSRERVDAGRIAMFGASRGGMMTYIALKRQTLNGGNDIKVAVTTSGIADLLMWAAEQPQLTSGLYQQLVGTTPNQNRGPFMDRSATYWPDLIRVPLLIQHGESDGSVSVNQSRRLYGLLKASNPAVKLITYPGGDHSLAAQNAGMPETFEWFSQYVAKPGEKFDYWGNLENMQRAWLKMRNAR